MLLILSWKIGNHCETLDGLLIFQDGFQTVKGILNSTQDRFERCNHLESLVPCLPSLKKWTSLKISKFIILKNWLGWSELALPFSNSTIKLFIWMESDHVDQIKLIESRQSHKVNKIKILQIKLNISNSIEKMHVFIEMLIRSC